MNWGAGIWGIGFICLGGVGLLAWWLAQRAQKRTFAFASEQMQAHLSTTSRMGMRWRMGLWGLALCLLILACMRPQYGYRIEKVGSDNRPLLLAIDVSKSMGAEDIKPSRMAVAKQHLFGILGSTKGQPVGLVVFAGAAYLQCPFTTDYDALRSYIEELHPGFLPVQGTNIGAVLEVASTLGDTVKSGFDVFLLSDGESLSGNPTDGLSRLAKQDIRIYSVGMGTPNGDPIPLRDAQGQVQGYTYDENNKLVLSKLDSATLTTVSEKTKGTYIDGASPKALDALLVLLDGQARSPSHETEIRHYTEWYMIPLSVSLLLLALQWLWPDKRRGYRSGDTRLSRRTRLRWISRLWPVLIIGLFGTPLHASNAQDAWHYRKGKAAYQNGAYKEAAAHFSRITSEEGRNYYNLGNAAYQKKAFEEASSYYENALPHLKTEAEKAWATYNQGNAAFHQGKFKEAVAFYRQSLTYTPGDKDTKINLELALKKLKNPPPPPKSPPPKPKDPPKEQPKNSAAAQQILKTLRQKEQFNRIPPITSEKTSDKDW